MYFKSSTISRAWVIGSSGGGIGDSSKPDKYKNSSKGQKANRRSINKSPSGNNICGLWVSFCGLFLILFCYSCLTLICLSLFLYFNFCLLLLCSSAHYPPSHALVLNVWLLVNADGVYWLNHFSLSSSSNKSQSGNKICWLWVSFLWLVDSFLLLLSHIDLFFFLYFYFYLPPPLVLLCSTGWWYVLANCHAALLYNCALRFLNHFSLSSSLALFSLVIQCSGFALTLCCQTCAYHGSALISLSMGLFDSGTFLLFLALYLHFFMALLLFLFCMNIYVKHFFALLGQLFLDTVACFYY